MSTTDNMRRALNYDKHKVVVFLSYDKAPTVELFMQCTDRLTMPSILSAVIAEYAREVGCDFTQVRVDMKWYSPGA